ncbi:MAG: hypothetical protein LBK05_02810 [Treponema sp.]|jgi:hydroxymethylpyrimidine pyrophosphatase-like HAD family hydrolase|nr:hypothetical protein [Treponema sp.]
MVWWAVILLACDLDDTLIHAQESPGDICVEYKDGKAHAFMPGDVYRKLGELDQDICLVPVTGKSAAQYQRIHYFASRIPPYALASCGGVLFRAGKRDPLWEEAFRLRFGGASEAMRLCLDEMVSRLLPRGDISWAKWVDRIFIAARSPAACGLASFLSARAFGPALDFFAEADRLYAFPKGFSKGSALETLRRQLKPELLVCAGDGILDLPMLRAADIALVLGERAVRQVGESPEFRGRLYYPGQGETGEVPAGFAEYIADFAEKQLKGER